MSTGRNLCLRCADVELVPSDPSGGIIEFFGCPACQRQYARQPGRGLTFRWLHPISILLYDKLYPTGRIGSRRSSKRPTEKTLAWVKEIELELAQPTQQVREILNNPQTEEQCRQYLREWVASVRAWQLEADGGSGSKK